jgi:hypothetical protein
MARRYVPGTDLDRNASQREAVVSGRACLFVEVRFDRFQDGRRILGGAPFNVAWNLRALGEDPAIFKDQLVVPPRQFYWLSARR